MGLTTAQEQDPRTIHVYQGVAWRGSFTWTQPVTPATDPPTYEPVDVTDYVATFTWLTKPGGVVLLAVTSPDSDDGGIDIDVATATFTVHLNGTQTALLTRDGAYELNVAPAANPTDPDRLSAGFANLILSGEPWPYPALVT